MSARILILSASIGSGHVQAGIAIETALKNLRRDIHVRHEDALDFANPAFRNLYQKTYADLANNAPEVLGWIYNYADRVWTTEEHGLAFERWNSGRLRKVVKDYSPDVVVCTHPMPADMTSWLLCKKKLVTKQAIVLTDFDINPLWLCHHYSLYFVAIEETREHLLRLGYRADRVLTVGIPINPEFAIPKSKTEMRIKHGLNPEAKTMLVSAGGTGLACMEQIITSLSHLPGNLQLVALCGGNVELKERLESIVREHEHEGTVPTTVLGYTTEVDEYMAAADLLIGKAGGLTTSEGLSKGLPLVIVNPIPGQEERNSDHLLEEGAAIRCNNLPVLPYKISQLLNDPLKMGIMRMRALSLSRPHAAETIARGVCQLARHHGRDSLIHPADHKCTGFQLSAALNEFTGTNG